MKTYFLINHETEDRIILKLTQEQEEVVKMLYDYGFFGEPARVVELFDFDETLTYEKNA